MSNITERKQVGQDVVAYAIRSFEDREDLFVLVFEEPDGSKTYEAEDDLGVTHFILKVKDGVPQVVEGDRRLYGTMRDEILSLFQRSIDKREELQEYMDIESGERSAYLRDANCAALEEQFSDHGLTFGVEARSGGDLVYVGYDSLTDRPFFELTVKPDVDRWKFRVLVLTRRISNEEISLRASTVFTAA